MKSTENASKKRIIDAALALFKERGFGNVSIKDICAIANCSNGTFYYHFGSMNGLLQSFTTINSMLDMETLTEILALSSPWEKLWRIHSSVCHYALSYGHTLYSQLIFLRDPETNAANQKEMEKITQLILPIVRQGQEAGEIRNQTPAELLSTSVGLIMIGVIHHWYRTDGQIDLESYMKTELQNLYDLRPDLRT